MKKRCFKARETEDARRALPVAVYYGVGGMMSLWAGKEVVQTLVSYKVTFNVPNLLFCNSCFYLSQVLFLRLEDIHLPLKPSVSIAKFFVIAASLYEKIKNLLTCFF